VCQQCLPASAKMTLLKTLHKSRLVELPSQCRPRHWLITCSPPWQVVSDQLSKVVFSGLYDRMTTGFVTCCGPTLAAAAECADLVSSAA